MSKLDRLLQIYELHEIADIIAGQSPESTTYNYEGNGLPFFQGKADFQEKYPKVRVWCTSTKRKESLPGDILMSVRAPVGSVNICDQRSVIGRGLSAIRPKKVAYGSYLYFFLKANEKQIDALGAGSTFKAITQETLKTVKIPIPPLDDQKRIAHLLGKVEGLIAQRKQHLQELDALIKSVFLEMFGDIRCQKSKHPLSPFRPYLKASSGKSSKDVLSSSDTGIPVFGGNGVNGWANQSLYEAPVVIAGRVGQQCGIIHVSRGPCWVTDNAIVLIIDDHNALNISYLAEAFQMAPIRERVKQLDLPFINQSMLLDYPLPLPPLALQNQFAAIVEKVGGVKSRYQQSLADLESLYGALSQKAFAGELDLSRIALPVVDEDIPLQASFSEAPQVQPPRFVVPEIPDGANLGDKTQRAKLIGEWLEAYLSQLQPGQELSTTDFIDAVTIALQSQEDVASWGLTDQDQLRDWIFKALEGSRIEQSVKAIPDYEWQRLITLKKSR